MPWLIFLNLEIPMINQKIEKMHVCLVVMLIALYQLSGCEKPGVNPTATQLKMSTKLVVNAIPVFPGRNENEVLDLNVSVDGMEGSITLTRMDLCFSNQSAIGNIDKLKVVNKGVMLSPKNEIFAEMSSLSLVNQLTGKTSLSNGVNRLTFSLTPTKQINLSGTIFVSAITLHFSNGSKTEVSVDPQTPPIRFGLVVRSSGQDNCDTYRIPGLVTTSKGTLIADYDNRYNSSKDLQENIDIGMSRSTDGGQTWESMKKIMDMGEWGGLPQELNGVGDPCVLYDHHTHTIWVAALWIHGSARDKMAWWDSKPGLKPGETGQFLLVKSTDDGLTWSAPINITEQIKKPEWQLLLQGPGRGITLDDGTLVFPAQFKADIAERAIDGGLYTCHSTIVYSKDHGETWHIGKGAKSNTTEAQLAVLSDGRLMLNMRDDRNRKEKGDANGRAVATTSDLGNTWSVHPSSNSALPEPNCMASLISAKIAVNGQFQHALFFSNPNNKRTRTNMTIKASLDDGLSWPYQLELNSADGFGYSCLTMVDSTHIGILYEGIKELYFQKISITDIISSSY
jgi:sialidase-1